MQKIQTFWLWYKQTAMLLGIPILMILLSIGLQKMFFTATCQIAAFKCQYAIGSDQALVDYMGDLVASNPGVDIVAKKR